MPVDLSASIFAQYKRARKRATEAEQNGQNAQAASAYREASALMRQYAQSAGDASLRKQRLERADTLGQLAQRLVSGKVRSLDPKGRMVMRSTETGDADEYENEVLGLITHTNKRWEDIGGLEDTKQAIKSAYGQALARKPAGVVISGWRNLLLYGPPGTGKTMIASATAGNLEATFFNVKVSNLLSKYFGESTKLISALYMVARRMAPAVVFLDEFESLTPVRGSGESSAERRIVSTFLAELDGLESKEVENLVLTMGSTNTPWLIDPAILSRFQRRIYIPLPDAAARRAILDINLSRNGHRSQLSLEELVQRTGGLSGREVEQLCLIGVEQMLRRANPSLAQIVDQGRRAVEAYELQVEPLSEADFAAGFAEVSPVATPEMLAQFEAWGKRAGS
jgi:katanin p60 ATPase-containing subunit A1